ncbi:hypothetical protein CQW23_24269 [Capsicum baccatum]|uniref:Uncharacterized protein n=1 Tax=Capsicum baccatum TaxID=33114 RepID=A0A2G2VU99_CAPBA|nr:hypothetical protein CQW23_24269 [Capsicum baccatum]
MAIFPYEVGIIRRFMRGLTLRIREVVLVVAQSGASLQEVVKSEKEFELIHFEKYGNLRDKRSCTLGQFSNTSSGGRGLFREDFCPQYNRPVQVAMQTSEGRHLGRCSYGLGQASHGLSQ